MSWKILLDSLRRADAVAMRPEADAHLDSSARKRDHSPYSGGKDTLRRDVITLAFGVLFLVALYLFVGWSHL